VPIHDWTRVDAGTFHDFHQGWTIEICNRLNGGIVPNGYFAMADQRISGPEPDVVYVRKANRIAIRHGLGRVVAMIEVVSPGNKDSRHAIASFVAKAVEFLRNGIHFLVVDPFPPGPRDPDGVAQAVWDQLAGEPLATRPGERSATVAAFDAGEPLTAYVESVTVGDPLPDAPLFLGPGWYVNVPLEETYRASWDVTPHPIRDLLETPTTGVQSEM
jgi:hypothetical protein